MIDMKQTLTVSKVFEQQPWDIVHTYDISRTHSCHLIEKQMNSSQPQSKERKVETDAPILWLKCAADNDNNLAARRSRGWRQSKTGDLGCEELEVEAVVFDDGVGEEFVAHLADLVGGGRLCVDV